MQKNIKEHLSKMGKQGAAKRWASRYELLQELSKFYSKREAEEKEFMKWPTKYIVELVEHAHKLRDAKNKNK